MWIANTFLHRQQKPHSYISVFIFEVIYNICLSRSLVLSLPARKIISNVIRSGQIIKYVSTIQWCTQGPDIMDFGYTNIHYLIQPQCYEFHLWLERQHTSLSFLSSFLFRTTKKAFISAWLIKKRNFVHHTTIGDALSWVLFLQTIYIRQETRPTKLSLVSWGDYFRKMTGTWSDWFYCYSCYCCCILDFISGFFSGTLTIPFSPLHGSFH